jgi:predicted RNA-binding protein with PUA-like domain
MCRQGASGCIIIFMETRSWFFQCNPAHFDIDAALRVLERIWWRVPQYTDAIHTGDIAVVWRSGKKAGIVGIGRVAADPQRHPADAAEMPFVLHEEEGAEDTTRALLRVQAVPFIPKDQVRAVSAFRQHQVVVAPMGTVFPVSAGEWTALKALLPPPPELVEGARSDLPPAFAWSQRAKGVMPLPGGYNGYLESLRKVCALVADERPTPVELASRLETVLQVKPTGARLRESFLRKIGVVSVRGGTCSLGQWTEKWLASGDDRIVIALLHSRCQFIGELLDSARIPRTADELLAVANGTYSMGWDTQTQIVNRRGWLQSAGMLTDTGDGRVKLSEQGHLLLSEISLHNPASGRETVKAAVTPAADNQAGSLTPPPHTGADTVVSALGKTSTDSSHPERFEQAVREAFSFLGFEAEWLGGSGKTDVLLDAALGRSDSYRVTVDCKTSASGSVGDHQVDWITLTDHKTKHDANYILLVAPNPSGRRLLDRASQQQVTVMSSDQLAGLCRQHAKTPLGLDDYRSLFANGGNLETRAVDERAEEVERTVSLAAAMCEAIRDRSALFGRLSARDLFLILSDKAVAEGTTEDELQALLDTLASPLLSVLDGSANIGYRVTTSAGVAQRRIELVARQLSASDGGPQTAAS